MSTHGGETERKRKREERQNQNGAVSGSVKDNGDGGRNAVAVEDREVDEFFAILRRMHSTVGSLKKAEAVNGVRHALMEEGEDVGSVGDGNGVNVDVIVGEREVVAENVGMDFDLNAVPFPEPDPV